jgi:uncharacterized protein with PQ loop repeat
MDTSAWRDALTTLYGAAGTLVVLSYLPQVRAIWASRSGAADVSLLMWSLWSLAATVTVLYALLVAHDTGFALVSLGNAAGCFAVTGLTLFKRARCARPAPYTSV